MFKIEIVMLPHKNHEAEKFSIEAKKLKARF